MEKPDAKHILVTGGIRSGKSNWAQKYLSGFTDVGYIATARCWDDEMRRRIDRHRASRPARWTTYEAYRDLDRVVEAGSEQALLLDCLSNLVTNWMMDAHQDYDRVPLEEIGLLEQQIREDVSRFLTACRPSGNRVGDRNQRMRLRIGGALSAGAPVYGYSRPVESNACGRGR